VSETTLDRIVADVRRRLDTYTEAPGLEDAAFEAVEARRREGLRSLGRALSNPGPALIAECKKASPSAGLICEDFDAAALAGAYSAGGAAAISVVTEPDSFQGDTRWLIDVRRTVDLPVLRKDFIVTRRQLFETAVLGVDAVLLIARILDQETLSSLLQTATELELEVLLEVFTDEDPATAVASGRPRWHPGRRLSASTHETSRPSRCDSTGWNRWRPSCRPIGSGLQRAGSMVPEISTACAAQDTTVSWWGSIW